MSRCGTRSGYTAGCRCDACRIAHRMTTYGSLFSGVGGFDLGCDAAGWDCAWQVEYDARCRQVLERHWPNVNRYEDVRNVLGSVRHLQLHAASGDSTHIAGNPEPGLGMGPRLLEPVDVITFGFPCQDLSVAGKRAGLDGERSGLFFEAIRIIREMREATDGTYPRVVVAENVVGLLSADGGDAMGRCLDALAEVGALAIEWRVLDAQWFGVPQRRRRVFLVAVFDPRAASAGPVFPEPESVRGDLAPERTPGQGIAGSLTSGLGSGGACDTHGLNGWLLPERTGTVTTTWAKGPGNTQVEEGLCVPVYAFGHTQGIDIQPSTDATPTLRTGGGGAAVSGAALGVRRLTPRECERLQGWPDDHTRYTADGTEVSDSARYRMAGNGVAAPVAKYVAECIDAILGDSDGR